MISLQIKTIIILALYALRNPFSKSPTPTNMTTWHCLLLVVLVVVPTCWSAVCKQPECQFGCGFTIGDDGCAKCDCDQNSYDGDCIADCPQDCGMLPLDNGCNECHCGELWFNPDTPKPPPGHHNH